MKAENRTRYRDTAALCYTRQKTNPVDQKKL